MEGTDKMKNSIARQIAAVFIGLMILVLAANLAVNNFFLVRFYLARFQAVLTDAYEMVDSHITDSSVDADFFKGDFSQIVSTTNLSLVVVNQNYEILVSTRDGNGEVMAGRIWGYITGSDQEKGKVLKKTDSYVIQQRTDEIQNMSFLEMIGELSCGYYIMMRIPMQAISANVRISNEFILYFSVIAVIVSVLLIMWLSRKIAMPIREMRLMGVQKLIVTNAAGGVNLSFKPGDLMMITDHLALFVPNPLIGTNDDRFGKRFPDMKKPCFCPPKENAWAFRPLRIW